VSETGSGEVVQVSRGVWEAMEARLTELEHAVGGGAKAAVASSAGVLTDRRDLLKHGALLAAGAMAGGTALVMAQAGPAEATTGTMRFGATNNAGASTTTLKSTDNPTLQVVNTAGGISMLADDFGTGTGIPLQVAVDNPLNTSPAVNIESVGTGDGLVCNLFGGPGTAISGVIEEGGTASGIAVHGAIDIANNSSAAVQADTIGKGSAMLATIDNINNAQPALSAATSGTGNAVAGQITNATSGANAVSGVTNGTGSGVYGKINNPSNSFPAVVGVTNGTGGAVGGVATGAGPALAGLVFGGTGPAIQGGISNPANTQPGVSATTNGTGPALQGQASGNGTGVNASSANGRGAILAGGAAQAKLVPSSASTHPSSGQAGDLFVDSTSRLWFCTIAGAPATWKQVQLA
jgi:hypothetical protein